jgi:hypothetical protein
MSKFLATLLICMPLLLVAQNRSRMNRDVFPAYGNYERRGWLISPSLTYMAPPFKQSTERIFPGGGDVYDITYQGRGKLGLGFEVGRFHVIDASKLISYVDMHVGIKSFRGVETFEATLYDPTIETPNVLAGEGTYSLQYATLSASASNIKQLSDFSFIQNSIGLNADYRFAENIYYNNRGLPIDLIEAPGLLFQMHYRLGFGYKVAQRFIIIPSIETPILTIHEFDDMHSGIQVFNTRYRPLILRCTIMMFDNKAQRKCPSKKPNRRSSESLFGMADSKRPW